MVRKRTPTLQSTAGGTITVITGGLWTELGTTMRLVRGQAGVSLRDLEARGSWRRSTISQVENARARPSRHLVEWFDEQVTADGLLVSIYAAARSRQVREARGAARPDHHRPRTSSGRRRGRGTLAGEDTGAPVSVGYEIVEIDPPSGQLVRRETELDARITLQNAGTAPWDGLRLRRLGAYSGTRLIGSPFEVDLPATAPGKNVEVRIALTAPKVAGSVVAYWTVVDGDGTEYAPDSPAIAVLLVVQ